MAEKDYVLEVKDLKTGFKVGRRRVHAVNGVNYSLRRGKTFKLTKIFNTACHFLNFVIKRGNLFHNLQILPTGD